LVGHAAHIEERIWDIFPRLAAKPEQPPCIPRDPLLGARQPMGGAGFFDRCAP
jgi:hypothetical protein